MISVVTAYYNRKKLFLRTLDSMKPYFGKIDFEVIVVDDGSDENERLEDIRDQYPFLKIIRLEKDKKWYKNSCIPFNIGFEAVKGDKIIIQNPECYHFGDIIKYVDENLEDNNYLSFGCYSLDKETTDNNQLFFDRNYIHNIIHKNNRIFNFDGDLGWYNHSKYRPKAFHFCVALTKKDLYDLGGFDERYAKGIGYDDDEFIWRIKRKNMKINFVDDCIVLHQNHYLFSGDKAVKTSILKNKSFKRNKRIFEEITKCNNSIKVNYLENQFTESNTKETTESNYFFEFNSLTNEIIQNKYKRKIGIKLLKFLSKI